MTTLIDRVTKATAIVALPAAVPTPVPAPAPAPAAKAQVESDTDASIKFVSDSFTQT